MKCSRSIASPSVFVRGVSLPNRRRDGFDQTRVKHIWYYFCRCGVGDEAGDRVGGAEFHLLSDGAHAMIKCTAKDPWEDQRVIQLVRKVAPTGGNDGSTGAASNIRHDFRRG